jgi:hypothetical protein
MAKRYMKLLEQKRETEEALRGLEAVRPPTNQLMNPEEAEHAGNEVEVSEWLDMFNYYTERLEDILDEMEVLEAELPPSDECYVHQLVGNGAGLCATASRYSAPQGGNGCQFCLCDQSKVGKE